MATVDEIFDQFKKLPDFDRYPLPEVAYEHFKIPKPVVSGSIMESLTYRAPPSVSLNTHGKIEIRGPAEGGVRPIEFAPSVPVEQTLLKDQTSDDTPRDLRSMPLIPPTKDSTTEIQHGSDPALQGLYDAYPYISSLLQRPQ